MKSGICTPSRGYARVERETSVFCCMNAWNRAVQESYCWAVQEEREPTGPRSFVFRTNLQCLLGIEEGVLDVHSWSLACILHIYQFSSIKHNNVICAQQPQEGAGDSRMEFAPPQVQFSLPAGEEARDVEFFLGLKLTWKVTDSLQSCSAGMSLQRTPSSLCT